MSDDPNADLIGMVVNNELFGEMVVVRTASWSDQYVMLESKTHNAQTTCPAAYVRQEKGRKT